MNYTYKAERFISKHTDRLERESRRRCQEADDLLIAHKAYLADSNPKTEYDLMHAYAAYTRSVKDMKETLYNRFYGHDRYDK